MRERRQWLGASEHRPGDVPEGCIPQSLNTSSESDSDATIRAPTTPSAKTHKSTTDNTHKTPQAKKASIMSWAGFKKNVNRAATQVMVKTGHVEQTHDRSYEVEERRYRVMENAATRLQKESKGYLDSLRAMTASQMRIAETIDAFYGDAGANDGVSRSYKQAVEDLDAETIKALDGPFRSTVLDPINRFCAYFPDINECIKKRNHKLLDYDRVRAQVKRLTEKPDKDVTKLPRTEKEAEMTRAAYEQLNEQLFNELPQLIELRVPYLDPSFEALVKIQLRFCAEAYSRMAQVQQYLDPDTRDQYANGNLDTRVEQILQEIRELSIAGTV
ncbi:BAR-domain-containing protein [Aureobasidium pullulans]|nr:BAR-domain-containing protein [Aureobasidium pullulans]THX41352.1 BAR-domain-containing protein [Aureobasidium pullulans]THY60383.1 BAR-domain-containing protein [Aureobasidium pullulans]THZ07960.1 BAR-domain-containing protein [Aureobasidium pullulans]